MAHRWSRKTQARREPNGRFGGKAEPRESRGPPSETHVNPRPVRGERSGGWCGAYINGGPDPEDQLNVPSDPEIVHTASTAPATGRYASLSPLVLRHLGQAGPFS